MGGRCRVTAAAAGVPSGWRLPCARSRLSVGLREPTAVRSLVCAARNRSAQIRSPVATGLLLRDCCAQSVRGRCAPHELVQMRPVPRLLRPAQRRLCERLLTGAQAASQRCEGEGPSPASPSSRTSGRCVPTPAPCCVQAVCHRSVLLRALLKGRQAGRQAARRGGLVNRLKRSLLINDVRLPSFHRSTSCCCVCEAVFKLVHRGVG